MLYFKTRTLARNFAKNGHKVVDCKDKPSTGRKYRWGVKVLKK